MDFDAIIIGGGACGLMCAVQAGYLGKKVLVLEKNDKVGAKILISGGGRCNYTNLHSSERNFISENPHFSISAFSQWTVEDTISFFENNGIFGQEKTLGQLFPTTNNAKDIVRVFEKLCKDLNQEILCNVNVKSFDRINNGTFQIIFEQGGLETIINVPKVVITTGGLPIKKMGATDFGLRTAQRFGMKVTKTAPALVPLIINDKDSKWYSQLAGTSIYSRVSNDRISFEENILFTHWGLSGPAILQISSYWNKGESINIDFLPDSSITELLQEKRQENGKQLLQTFLGNLFTKRFAESLISLLPTDKNIGDLTKAEIESIDNFIHNFSELPAGDKGYDKAEVMRGGVSTDELSSKTLEAKKIPGLFFGGECVDVTGWLGGYNFQWAWASGYVIAQNI
jgi:predicted Rossmann fold flavoprotein